MIADTGFRIVDVSDAWPRYAQRAQKARTDGATLHSVFGRCRAGLALCLECDDGIAVVTLAGAPGVFELRVLLAISAGGKGSFARHEAGILAVARDMGAKAVSFRTDRAPAWRRLLSAGWYQVDDDRFWKEV